MTDPARTYEALRAEMGRVLIGKASLVERLTVALLTRGHVLLEGVPGVAKTTVANLFARASGLEYTRIQMTPDVLPADITGTHVYREATGEFTLQRGPVFANVVVADEINRATPKTQSALLEAMEERRVTIEGETLALPTPFMVIATQNPIELEGSLHPDETLYVNGSLLSANEALEYARENGRVIRDDDDGRLYEVETTTQTLDVDGRMRSTECLVYEKDYDGQLFTIETKSGRAIKVSGNHPFLVNRSGTLEWVDARDVDPDDYLVVPTRLVTDETSFPSHEETLERLGSEFGCVREGDLARVLDGVREGRELTVEEVDALRIACGLSKADVANQINGSYEQVLSFFRGCDNGLGSQVLDAVLGRDIQLTDYIESFRIHRFDRAPTAAEAGFLVGFVLSDGRLTENLVSITQRNYPGEFDRWVELVRDLGIDVDVTSVKGGRRATVRSKPLVRYLEERYRIDDPASLLDAPEEFRRSFLQIFLFAESHFDADRRRITFTQKDRTITNLVAYLLLQFGIRPWIEDQGRVFRVKVQGSDIETYLEQFEWPGEEPDVTGVVSVHRTTPLPSDVVERVVDVLGLRYQQGFSQSDWYNGFTGVRTGAGEMSEKNSRSFVSEMRRAVEDRQERHPSALATDDLSAAAKLCGVSMTDIVDETSVTKHGVWQAYTGSEPPVEAIQFVSDAYSDRVAEADRLTRYLERLVDNDVAYEPIERIEAEPYEGPVVGLSVPHTHNYVAGFGACGINHNTFELPEAQRDRFQLKVPVDLPTREEERAILDRFDADPELAPAAIEQVVGPDDLLAAREAVAAVHVDESVKEYLLDVVAATREHQDVEHGASPRASLAFLNAGKARAAIRGRDYVIPDDVKALAEAVLRHRLVLTTDAELSDVASESVVADALDSVEAPGAEAMAADAAAASDGGRRDDG